MPKYQVHVYATVRVVFGEVEAEDQQAAIAAVDQRWDEIQHLFPEEYGANVKAEDGPTVCGFADDCDGYLVDEVGDTAYARSRDYDRYGRPLLGGMPTPPRTDLPNELPKARARTGHRQLEFRGNHEPG